tara:strand:+ start:17646 stop:17900 length:255 start_codon:yes stop_codon:yes gene_type:complete
MIWEKIIKKDETVKELVHHALQLQYISRPEDFKESYTIEDIDEFIDAVKKELRYRIYRGNLMEFDEKYAKDAIKLLEQAKERLQ